MEVKNGDIVLEFDGELIGDGSSAGEGRPRWHEVEIFRLMDGKYVIHKIGRSSLPGEVDYHSAQVADDAHGAVRALYSRDKQGIWKMTIVAEDAANIASDADEKFAAAFKRQRLTA